MALTDSQFSGNQQDQQQDYVPQYRQGQDGHGSATAGNDRGGVDFGSRSAASRGGADVVDIRTRKEIQTTRSELEQLKAQNAEQAKLLNQLKGVFGGGEKQQPSKTGRFEQALDQVLQMGLDAERDGRPMPLTVSTAATMYEQFMDQQRLNDQLLEEIKSLRGQTQQLSNPAIALEQQAYNQLDSHVSAALDQIYGRDPSYGNVKNAQFQAIGRQIVEEIKDLQQNDPQEWRRLTQNQQYLKNMAVHFVERNMPPVAKQILSQKQLEETPMSMRELEQAYREAESTITDPNVLEKVTSELRQEILSRKYFGRQPQMRQRLGWNT
jgi:hypothetical protein